MRGRADGGEGELRGWPPGTLDPEETIEDALYDLVRFGHEGLPVVGEDGRSVVGWVTNRNVLRALVHRLGRSIEEVETEAFALGGNRESETDGLMPPGYRPVEFTVPEGRKGGTRIRDVPLPPATLVISVRRGTDASPRGNSELQAGDRLAVLTTPSQIDHVRQAITGDQVATSRRMQLRRRVLGSEHEHRSRRQQSSRDDQTEVHRLVADWAAHSVRGGGHHTTAHLHLA